jgi:hypothetical protein
MSILYLIMILDHDTMFMERRSTITIVNDVVHNFESNLLEMRDQLYVIPYFTLL